MALPPDPNQGAVPGLLGNLFPGNNAAALYQGLLSDPATQQQMNQRALQAMAGSFAQSAMPTRMPIPFGAVLGQAAAAVGPAQDAVMQARLQEAQGEQERALASLTTQKVGVLGGMGADQAAYDAAMAQGGPAGPMVPGTLGAPAVATVQHDAGPGWMAGYTIPDGAATATPDPKKSGSENLNSLAQAAAPMALPEGYTVQKISGYRPGAEVAGGGGPSQHAKDNAADFQIYTPDGKPVPKEGPDTTGLYGKLALTMYRIASPDIKPWLAWGGNFSTGVTGPADLMHFDFAGDRGHRGTLAQMEQQWLAANQPQPSAPARPTQVASAGPPPPGLLGPGAGLPAGGPGPGAAPPPGNVPLGPSGRTTAQLADQARADAGGPVPQPPGPPAPGPVSPQFLAALKASGRTDAEIAQIVATMSGPQPAAAGPPAPGGAPPGLLAQGGPAAPPGPAPGAPPPGPPPAAPPQTPGPPAPLVTPPSQPPAVPRIAQPQPTAAPPPAQPAPGGGGTIPGAPNAAAIAAAKKLERDYIMMQLPVPPSISAVANWDIKGAEAQRDALIKFYTTGQRPGSSVPLPGGGYATAPGSAAENYANEQVFVAGYGYVQRKNLPGFTMPGGGSPPGAGPRAPTPGPGAAAPGPGAPAPAPGTGPGAPALTAPGVVPGDLLAGATDAQKKAFETNLAVAKEQLKPYQADLQNAPLQIGQAAEINDLLKRTTLGWGADAKLQASMILQSLGASPENIKTFLGTDTAAAGALNKLFLQFSTSAVSDLGKREAASVVGMFARAYPSLESDPRAAELMTNALAMQAQWKLDRANAAEAYERNQQQNMGPQGLNYRGLTGFQQSFNKTNDFHDYWRAASAMSGFPDIAWRGTTSADQHRILALIPPGRQYLNPNGQPFTKPGTQ